MGKQVRCINDNYSGGGVIKGKIYEVVRNTTYVDGTPMYVLKDIDGECNQSRFQDVASTGGAVIPPIVSGTGGNGGTVHVAPADTLFRVHRNDKPAPVDLSDWKVWREHSTLPGMCACGIAKQVCTYHKE